jgi:hypothetical protein
VLDLKTRRQAATALRDLAANDEYKLQYAEEGGIEALVGTSPLDPSHSLDTGRSYRRLL